MLVFSVLVKNLLPYSGVIYVTDILNVLDTYNEGPKAGANSSNCDLWREIFLIIYSKAFLASVGWMPSPLEAKGKLPPQDVFPSAVEASVSADRYTAQAAVKFQIPHAATVSFLYHAKLIKKIQKD